MEENKNLGLYIHIPFCVEKCLYCDFVSYKVSDAEKHKSIETYIKALKEEISFYKDELGRAHIKTIFIGGGTPSSIEGRYILEIVNHLKQFNPLTALEEFTIEVNPGTLNEEKINAYLSAGINRVSMGVQSSRDSLLKSIGRIHTFNEFLTTYHGIREKGFRNINLDMMFGLPGQTLEDVLHTVKILADLMPEHISAYSLKIEEGTPMYRLYESGTLVLPDEATERDMYRVICKELETRGYHQYEISNFAKEGLESRHNLTYWRNEPYLGFGVAAHSKMDSVRFNNYSNMMAYTSAIEKGNKPVEEEIQIDESEDLFETIILGLRLNEGLEIEAINAAYNMDFLSMYQEAISRLEEQGLIVMSEGRNRMSLTDRGRDLSNQVFLAFMA